MTQVRCTYQRSLHNRIGLSLYWIVSSCQWDKWNLASHHMMHACIYCTYAHVQYAQTHIHTYIHTHACARAHTHTHTHTQILVEYKIYCCTYALVMNQLVFVLISIVNCPSIWNKCKVALNFSFHEAQKLFSNATITYVLAKVKFF